VIELGISKGRIIKIGIGGEITTMGIITTLLIIREDFKVKATN